MLKGQLHFFTGENSYALEQELLRWKQAFFLKHGSENYLELQSKEASFSDLLDAVSVMPFIAERRLFVLRGMPCIEKEEAKFFAEAIHPQTVVVIADAKPDKRLGVTKEVMQLAEVQNFPSSSSGQLEAWGRGVVVSCGASIRKEAWNRLTEIVGTEQWMLDSELRKLSAHAAGEITEAHVDELAVPSGEQIVWRLTDLIGSKKIDAALDFLRSRIDRGEDPYGLWVILLNMIKNTTLVWSGLQSGLRDERSISSAFGIYFLSVRGLLPLARSLDRDSMSALVTFASDADLALKTGGLHYTKEHQEEVIAVIERAILFCR